MFNHFDNLRMLLLPLAAIHAFGLLASPGRADETAGDAATANADDSPKIVFPSPASDWHGFPRYRWTVAGHPLSVVAPTTAAPGRPWVWHGEFFGHKPEPDIELLRRGFHIVY